MNILLTTAFCALGLSVLAQEAKAPQPELLEVPAGWSFERLDLPLSFAPDLEYEGFEEITLSPGMFDQASAQYWSYALALRLDGDVVIDRHFAADFFLRYYRGLCGAVGRARGSEVDLDSIRVVATLTDGSFLLTAELFDVFGDGSPLTLSLELDVHATPASTELFGIGSPAPMDAPVWDELRAIRSAWWQTRAPAVYLNHLFWVPDAATYEALVESELLRGLAVSEERHTVRQDLEYTGLYAYGPRTYFEFLRPAGGPLAPGASGIAFGHERREGIDHFAQALKAEGVRTFAGARTRALDGVDVPWFRILGIEAPHADTRLSLFSMEYDPTFLTSWHANSAPGGASRSRGAVLERYAASLDASAKRSEAPLLDIETVLLALDPGERERFVTLARAADFDIVESESGPTVCRAPEVEFRIEHATAPGGVLGFDARLRPGTTPTEEHLGNVTITLADDLARVRFRLD